MTTLEKPIICKDCWFENFEFYVLRHVSLTRDVQLTFMAGGCCEKIPNPKVVEGDLVSRIRICHVTDPSWGTLDSPFLSSFFSDTSRFLASKTLQALIYLPSTSSYLASQTTATANSRI